MMRILSGSVAMWLMVAAGMGATTDQTLPAVSELTWTKPDRFWFRKTISGANVWLGVDAQYGVKEPLFDHQRLAIELGVRTGGEFTPNDLPLADPAARFVVKYDGSNAYIQEGAMAIEFVLGGAHWRCDLQIKWNWNLVPPTDYECLSRRPVIPGVSDKPIVAPNTVRSPDGFWDALIENHNVVRRPASGGGPLTQKLTTDGTAAFAYQLGSITWAADSKSLAAYRVHEQVWLAPSVTGNVKAQLHRAQLTVK
jgi:hypothetical protein